LIRHIIVESITNIDSDNTTWWRYT